MVIPTTAVHDNDYPPPLPAVERLFCVGLHAFCLADVGMSHIEQVVDSHLPGKANIFLIWDAFCALGGTCVLQILHNVS